MSSPIETGRTAGEGPVLFVEEQRFLSRPWSLALLLGVLALAVWAVTSSGGHRGLTTRLRVCPTVRFGHRDSPASQSSYRP